MRRFSSWENPRRSGHVWSGQHLHALAAAANRLAAEARVHTTAGIRVNYLRGFLPRLREAAKELSADGDAQERAVQFFVECCLTVGYLQAHHEWGEVVLRTDRLDVAFLLSHVFGLPTEIPGFDDLFGGGGLMLAEGRTNDLDVEPSGRAILTVGEYGTGKSLLAIEVAVEVA